MWFPPVIVEHLPPKSAKGKKRKDSGSREGGAFLASRLHPASADRLTPKEGSPLSLSKSVLAFGVRGCFHLCIGPAGGTPHSFDVRGLGLAPVKKTVAGLLLRGIPCIMLHKYAPVPKGGAIVVTAGKSFHSCFKPFQGLLPFGGL